MLLLARGILCPNLLAIDALNRQAFVVFCGDGLVSLLSQYCTVRSVSNGWYYLWRETLRMLHARPDQQSGPF